MSSGRVNNFPPKSRHKSKPLLHGDNLDNLLHRNILILNHWHKRNLLIGLTLGFELITSKGEKITFTDLDNSGIISETGSIIKLYCYYIIEKDWEECGGFKQMLNIVFSFNCLMFHLAPPQINMHPENAHTSRNYIQPSPKWDSSKSPGFRFQGCVVEVLFLPSHLDVAFHWIIAKTRLLSIFSTFSIK